MSSRNIAPAIGCLLVLLFVALSICNWHAVSISFFGTSQDFTLGLSLLLALGSGIFAGVSVSQLSAARHKTSNLKLQEWQVQDAKLIASVQTDREKQLESKIATLESALKAALKKSQV